MLVKQGFPLHGRAVMGQLQDPSLSKELSRIITSQGAVIRYMRDGSTEVTAPACTTVYCSELRYHDSLLKNPMCAAGSICRWLCQFQP